MQRSDDTDTAQYTTWMELLGLQAGAGEHSLRCCPGPVETDQYRIYIIEGVVTVIWGLICFILVPSSYEKAFFLNEDDKEVMRHRATVTHQYSGGKGEFTLKDIAVAAKDIKTWIHSALQFCVITPLYGEPVTTIFSNI